MTGTAEKYIGYLEHRTNALLGVFDANVGKGGCTLFAAVIQRHYRCRDLSGMPWCATFLHAVCLEAWGKKAARQLLGVPHPGTRVLARRLGRKGWLLGREQTPKRGDIIFCHNGDGCISHCGIVTGVEDGKVISVEGNTHDPTGHFPWEQGGAVAVRERTLTDPAIVNYGRIKNVRA